EAVGLEERQKATYEKALAAAKEIASRAKTEPATPASPAPHIPNPEVSTAVPAQTLSRIGHVLTTVPAGFHLNPKMVSQLARRGKMAEGAQPLDWSTAEALAFGSLLLEGTPIRLSGQDTSRGTFSQRHIVFHDSATGETWTPLSDLDP